jgi:hypothetical protein
VTDTDASPGTDAGLPAADLFMGDPDTWGRNKLRKDEARPAGKGPLQVGVAMRYLDAPVGTSMAGYGGRLDGRATHWSDSIKGTSGFYGMQSIKVLAIEVGGERMALVKSPQMSSESYLTDAIARHLQQKHQLDFAGRVITMAGHSHHATARYWPVPETLGNVGCDSFDPEVAELTAGIYADAIAEAWSKRAPAEWGHAFADDWDPNNEVYRDRRANNNPTYGKDPRLDVMAFRRKSDAAPLAVVIHFAIHGTVFGGDNDLFTEDAPGHVEHKFEEAFFAREGKPVYGMFAQASGGDASPAGDALGHPELARLERLGEAAAPKILKVYDQISWQAETELAIRSERIELIHERIYAGRPWQNEFAGDDNVPYTWGGWQCKVVGLPKGETMQGKPKLCVDMGTLLELLGAKLPHNAAHETYLTAARLGDLWLMTLPGEPTWSITKYAREQAAKLQWNGKPAQLMVIGYAQDHLLYLSSPDDWYTGGYEAEMNLWGPGAGVFLADEGLGLVQAMAAGQNGPTLFEESPSLAPVLPFTPRKREASVAAGKVVAQPPAQVARTQTVQFAAHCGDPALGSPRVEVQRATAAGFEPVPALHGWQGRHYDNSRYEMVSVYDPDPPQLNHQSVPARSHLWRFYWQVPADWPTGSYRLHLQCPAIDQADAGAKTQTLTIDSTAFAVALAEGTTLTVQRTGEAVTVAMRVPGVAQVKDQSKAPGVGRWVSGGYRLLDAAVKHTELALVRTPLTVELLDAGGQVLATAPATFDATQKANVVKLASVPAQAKSLRAWLTADQTPAKVTAPLPPL